MLRKSDALFTGLRDFKELVMQPPQSEEKTNLPQVQLDREAALEYACRTKVNGMNLGNHRSAYKCLGKLDGEFKVSLQRMGYGRRHIVTQ